jgi:hypothetical protein
MFRAASPGQRAASQRAQVGKADEPGGLERDQIGRELANAYSIKGPGKNGSGDRHV